jgi:hypothetical protein
MVDQLRKINTTLRESKTLGLNTQANTIAGNVQFQEARVGKDFQANMTEVGSYAIPGLTKGFRDMGDGMHQAQVWLHAHRDVEARINREVTADVQGLEKWVTGHHSDWVTLRHDAMWAFTNLHNVGTQLGYIADGALEVYKVARRFIDLTHGPDGTVGGNIGVVNRTEGTPLPGNDSGDLYPGQNRQPVVIQHFHGKVDKSDAAAIAKAVRDAVGGGQHTLRQSGTSSGSTKVPRHMTAAVGSW